MAEPLTPEPGEIDNLAWLVWYARKRRGKAEDVARAAWDENPFLRRAEYRAASQGDEGLREAAWDAVAVLAEIDPPSGYRAKRWRVALDALRAALAEEERG